jgi:L-aminopeptidase/D-esterase-like protein
MGYAACAAAEAGDAPAQGNVGAGAGVTVGKWSGFMNLMKGGFGAASLTEGDLVVGAVAVVNAVGDVVNPDGTVLAGARDPEGGWMADRYPRRHIDPSLLPGWGTNTTLVAVMTNASLSRSQLARLPQQANNGMAIAIRPVHTRHDGDVAFGLATGEVMADDLLVYALAVEAVGEAIRNAVRHSRTVLGIPGLAGE